MDFQGIPLIIDFLWFTLWAWLLREKPDQERRLIKPIGILVAPTLAATVAMGDIYSDPTGDIATGNPNLDITSVEMKTIGWDLFVTITVADLNADWGKYMVFMDYGDDFMGNFGAPENNNPWGRDVGGYAGFDAFTGIWIDGGGGMSHNRWSGDSWYEQYQGPVTDIDWGNNSITIGYMDLAYSLGNYGVTEIGFEVGTTGGNWGDPAIDLLGGEGTQPGWGGSSTITDLQYFTIPAPSALALLAMAGLSRRRRH